MAIGKKDDWVSHAFPGSAQYSINFPTSGCYAVDEMVTLLSDFVDVFSSRIAHGQKVLMTHFRYVGINRA